MSDTVQSVPLLRCMQHGTNDLPCRSETGLWATTFDYCRGKCRTSSNSTVNENSYLARNKYCFSALGAPWSGLSAVVSCDCLPWRHCEALCALCA